MSITCEASDIVCLILISCVLKTNKDVSRAFENIDEMAVVLPLVV